MRQRSASLLALLLLAASTALASADDARARLEESRAALERGESNRAVRTASQAEELFRQAGDAAGEARAANQGGLGHLARAEYAEALARFDHALGIDVRLGDGESAVANRNSIGSIRFYQGRYIEAQLTYQAALEKAGRSHGESWSLRRRQLTLINLGVLYEQLGEYGKALESYRDAGASPTGLAPAEHAQLLATLGGLYRRLQDPARALEAYGEARRRFEQAQQMDGAIQALHQIGVVKAVDRRDVNGAGAAFTEALGMARRAGNARLETLSRLLLAQALDSRPEFQAALELAREAGAVEEQWTALFGIARGELRDGRKSEALGLCRDVIRLIESVRGGWHKPSLKAGFLPGRRDVYDAAIGLALDGGNPDPADLLALMEAARGRHLPDALHNASGRPTMSALQARLDENVLLVEYWLGRSRGAALWMTRKGAGVVPFALATEVEALEESTSSAMAAGDGWREWSRGLGKLLLSGLPLAEAREVIVVPDGQLHRVPFDALDDGAGLLVRRIVVSYLPAAGLLVRAPRTLSLSAPWRVQLVGLGDVTPDLVAPLPGRAVLHRDGFKSWLWSEEVARAPLLHLGSPATIDLTDSNRSRLWFAPEPGRPGSDRLFWGELLTVKLPGVELLTLGAPRAGDTSELSRALLATGAASTLTTLWSVPDRPAAEFLRHFYRQLGRGESRRAALRTAKLALLDSGGEFARPRYWAAFVLHGEGGKLSPVVRWWWIGVGAGLVLAMLLVVWRRTR